jgi:hypothetical protein
MLQNFLNWFESIKYRSLGFLGSKKTETSKVLSDGTNKTKFYLNDPTTPSLTREQTPPSTLALSMTVVGDKGPGYPLGSSQQQASACKIVLNNALNYMMTSYKTTVSTKRITRWAAITNLTIRPRAGVDINAYYDRSSLSFFYFNNRIMGKVIYTCDSHSVVTHEFGHAFLDILRPDFWSAQAAEVWAYHEAFGDMTALISCLQYDELINYALKETNGNMLQSNTISRLAAEMGKGLYDVSIDKTGLLNNCLRDLSIVFNYSTPESLPSDGPDNILTSESHSFSRVFSSAFYELLIKMARKNVELGRSPLDSMKIARDVASRYLIKATSAVPLTNRLFDAVARQMILIDKSEGNKYQSALNEVFNSRKILLNRVLMLNDADIDSVKRSIKGSYELHLYDRDKYIKTHSTKTIKLKDVIGISALNNNPLFKLDIEVPNQTGYYFDENNKLLDIVETTQEEAIESALNCVSYLNQNNLVGKHKDALFEIKNNKLVRKLIMCKCGLPNYCDPNAPEYGKPWKPANNSSCCKCQGPNCKPRSCDCNPPEKPPKRKTTCFTAVKSCCNNAYELPTR